MTATVSVLSSMATRRSLADIAQTYEETTGAPVAVTSIGGVEAARRVREGAAFDVVVLADGALRTLAGDGFIAAETIRVFAHSATAIAVRAGMALPERCDGDAIKAMMLEPAVEGSVQLGYPEGTVFGIGLALLVSTALYAVPRTAFLGAILLTGYLGGAVATQVRMEDPWFLFPAFLGVLVWGGLFLRDGRVRALVSG